MIDKNKLVYGKFVVSQPDIEGLENSPYPAVTKDVVAHLIVFLKEDKEGHLFSQTEYGYDGPYYNSQILEESELPEYKQHCEQHRLEPKIIHVLNEAQDIIKDAVRATNQKRDQANNLSG